MRGGLCCQNVAQGWWGGSRWGLGRGWGAGTPVGGMGAVPVVVGDDPKSSSGVIPSPAPPG